MLSSFQLDDEYINQILEKSKTMQSEIENQSSDDLQNYSNVINSIGNFLKNIAKNLKFYQNSSIFQEDFRKSVFLINSFFDYYLKSNKIPKGSDFFKQIQNDIISFSQIFNVFYTNYKRTFKAIKQSQIEKKICKKSIKLLGLQAVLFNLSVKIEPKEEVPFYTSQFLRVYRYYNSILNFEKPIAAFKSVGGSGKSICVPIMILCRFLEEKMDTSFLLMTEPNREIVGEKTAFFRSNIGNYANVTDDVNNIIDSCNETENKKIILGILTPEELLYVIQNQKNKSDFFKTTRILMDEVHEQSIYTDVILVLIKSYKENLQLPLSFSMMSATIKENHRYIQFFKDEELNVTKLVHKPLFKVSKRSITNGEIQAITDETSNVIEEMAKMNSKIEEGHLICFVQGIESAQILKGSIISHFQQFEQKDEMKNVVIMKTILKPNESADSYFSRLRKEFELVKGMNEVDGDKNDCLYFVILDLIDQSDISKIKIAQNNFPEDLHQINKIICSLYSIDSLAIDKLSVVIDFGLSKVWFFNCDIGFYASHVIRSSRQSMNQKKGLLGRTMKGLYISFFKQDKYLAKQIFDETETSVVHDDLTQGILNLKDIDIDFEKLILPAKPNLKNLKYSLNKLKEIKAIDEELKITPYGRKIVEMQRGKNSIIPIYYAHAILKFSDKFSSELQKDAQFFGFYLALLISMAMNLIQESMAEKLISVFSEDSDVETLVNASRILLSSDLIDNDELRNLVESYGFSYSTFLTFRFILQKEANNIFKKEEISISKTLDSFVRVCTESKLNMIDIINKFIISISSDQNWFDIHTLEFDYITESSRVKTRPTLAFRGNQNLAIWNNSEKKSPSEIRITQRPGWNGISIPTKCICLDIYIYYNRWMLYGNIVHGFNKKEQRDIISLKLPKVASNPWFNVLIDTYFSHEKLNIRRLKNVFDFNRKHFQEQLFYISNTIEQTFLSFIPMDRKAASVIQKGIDICLKLMPFVPRSILIYRPHPRALVEVISDGTQSYNSFLSMESSGDKLNRKYIDYCVKHINELATIEPQIRICAVFFSKECTVEDYNQRRLYFVTSQEGIFDNLPKIIKVIEKQRKPRYVIQNMNESRNIIHSRSYHRKDIAYFIFPPKFIHPALLYHQESFSCVCKWLSKCDYIKILRIVDQQHFLMPIKCIKELQKRIRNEKDLIKEQIGLKYVAIPIPSIVYEKAYMIIKEHPNWIYNNRFKVVIVIKEEEKDVKDLIKEITDEIKEENPSADNLPTDTLGCCYICDDPDNPTLTTYPITIYYKNGKTYTNKMCRDCLVLNIQNIVNSFFNDEKINQDQLDLILAKPQPIPTVDLSETKGGDENWPQIPLGQIISILINNDDEISALVSAWLNSVQEFTIRNLAKEQFTFCPDHPRLIFSINDYFEANKIICKDCHNVFCTACLGWHKKNFMCDEKKEGKNFRLQKKCPKCKKPTIKDGGCNHITCPCGCHWCYVCGKGFITPEKCYNHMRKEHGDIY